MKAIQFLDIISDYPRRRVPVDTVTAPKTIQQTTTDGVPDTISSAQHLVGTSNPGSDDNTILIWVCIAAVVALFICLYAVYSYRRCLAVART